MTESTDVVCRMARRDDLPELLALLPHIERDPSRATVPTLARAEEVFDAMARQGDVFIFVATLVGERGIVGTCTLGLTPSLSHGGRPWATIETVVVAPDRRGQGIGTRLMAHAIDHARQAGCYKAQLITPGRPDQIGFYRQAGFSWEGVGFKAYL